MVTVHAIFDALNTSRILYALAALSGFLNSQQIIRINALFRKARRLELCSSPCLCDVSEYLRLADCRLFNRIQSSSHCLSHLLPPEKHHLGLRPRDHRYTFTICPNELCKSPCIPQSLFSFLWFFHLQCLIYSVLYYCITFAFVICLIQRYHQNRLTMERLKSKLSSIVMICS